MPSVRYDEAILQKVVDGLYRQAGTVVALATLLGAAIGASAGSFALVKERDLASTGGGVGLVLGLVLGYAVGQSRAFSLRAQAQTLLLQMQVERNTLIAATEIKALVRRAINEP